MNRFCTRLPPQSFSTLSLGAALLAAAALWFHASAGADEAVVAAPLPPEVEVSTLQPRQIRAWQEFSGRLAAVERAEIKPLVGGTIQQVLFTEGEQVQQGSPLFVIDPRPHQAALERAEAQLATARSRETLAVEELRRAEQLLDSKLLSQSLFDSALSDVQVSRAAVQEAESALSQARLNLEYAHIEAPISGRIGRAELTVGNVVEPGANAPVLTSIVSDDRFYAEFNVSEQVYLQSVRGLRKQQALPVELRLAEDDAVVYQGHIHAFDNQLDVASGTIRARALFENSDGALTAGMYANLRLGSARPTTVLLVPERAIGTNQSHKFVYVVDADNVAQYRQISPAGQYEGQRIVTAGLAAGERVVVNGLSRVTPNLVVSPVEVEPVPQVAALAR